MSCCIGENFPRFLHKKLRTSECRVETWLRRTSLVAVRRFAEPKRFTSIPPHNLRGRRITLPRITLAAPTSVVQHGGCARSHTAGEPAGQCSADGGYGVVRREDRSSGHDAGIPPEVSRNEPWNPLLPPPKNLNTGTRGAHT